MKPVSPVMPELGAVDMEIGKGQPEYTPLPAVYVDSRSCPVISRWRPTDEERAQIANGADIVLVQLTFRNPFQPVNLLVMMPDESLELGEL